MQPKSKKSPSDPTDLFWFPVIESADDSAYSYV